MNQYEAMFVFDPTFGGSFENCEAEIGRLMERAKGQVILSRKWDERRLAFRIKGRKRGIYVLTYFNAPADSIASLEHDAKLSEHILRMLVLRAEGVTREAMEEALGIRSDEHSGSGDGEDSPAKSGEEAKTETAAETTATAEALPVSTETAVTEPPPTPPTNGEVPV